MTTCRRCQSPVVPRSPRTEPRCTTDPRGHRTASTRGSRVRPRSRIRQLRLAEATASDSIRRWRGMIVVSLDRTLVPLGPPSSLDPRGRARGPRAQVRAGALRVLEPVRVAGHLGGAEPSRLGPAVHPAGPLMVGTVQLRRVGGAVAAGLPEPLAVLVRTVSIAPDERSGPVRGLPTRRGPARHEGGPGSGRHAPPRSGVELPAGPADALRVLHRDARCGCLGSGAGGRRWSGSRVHRGADGRVRGRSQRDRQEVPREPDTVVPQP